MTAAARRHNYFFLSPERKNKPQKMSSYASSSLRSMSTASSHLSSLSTYVPLQGGAVRTIDDAVILAVLASCALLSFRCSLKDGMIACSDKHSIMGLAAAAVAMYFHKEIGLKTGTIAGAWVGFVVCKILPDLTGKSESELIGQVDNEKMNNTICLATVLGGAYLGSCCL